MLLEVQNLDRVEADHDYIRLHTAGRSYLVGERLHAMESRLYPEGFLRIHRSTLVDITRIRVLQHLDDGGGLVILENGVRLRSGFLRCGGRARSPVNGPLLR